MSKKLFENPKEVFEEQLNDLFSESKETETDQVISVFSLILSAEKEYNKKDFVELYHLVGLETFVSVVSLFEKRTITFPSVEKIREDIILAIVFYYKEIRNYTWKEIKEILPFEFSSISYSFRLKKLDSFIIEKMKEILKKEEDK